MQRDDDGEVIQGPTEIHLPDIPSAFGYLLGYFYLSGQATQTGMGLVPLSWQEIKAFREENELEITLWERELLKKMSEAYCTEYSRASDPKRPAPYAPEQDPEEVDGIAVAMRIREQMQFFKKGQ